MGSEVSEIIDNSEVYPKTYIGLIWTEQPKLRINWSVFLCGIRQWMLSQIASTAENVPIAWRHHEY